MPKMYFQIYVSMYLLIDSLYIQVRVSIIDSGKTTYCLIQCNAIQITNPLAATVAKYFVLIFDRSTF